MKNLSLICFSLSIMTSQFSLGQNFITKWYYPEAATQIGFGALTTDTVYYTWNASPSGSSGSGSFIQTTAHPVFLRGIDMMDGDTITLEMEPDHLSRFYNSNAWDSYRLIDVVQWGEVNWTSMRSAFAFCENMSISALDTPDLSNVTNMRSMFLGAEKFNQDISHWDVSNVTDMSHAFRSESFNQDIGNWDVSNVTNMSGMFAGASDFNQDLSGWDVSNVEDMSGMFSYNSGPKNNIGISSWDVSNVKNMSRMFSPSWRIDPDISNWDVSNVTDMSRMFYGARLFNQNLGNWNLHPDVDMTDMLDSSGMDCDHYSASLIGWKDNNSNVINVNLGATRIRYGTNAVEAREALIIKQGWTIDGDRFNNYACDEVVNTRQVFLGALIDIYPNPASHEITIEGKQLAPSQIHIFNSVGQELTHHTKFTHISASRLSLDVSTLIPGMYIVKIGSGSAKFMKK